MQEKVPRLFTVHDRDAVKPTFVVLILLNIMNNINRFVNVSRTF